jgi:hypothetical protein
VKSSSKLTRNPALTESVASDIVTHAWWVPPSPDFSPRLKRAVVVLGVNLYPMPTFPAFRRIPNRAGRWAWGGFLSSASLVTALAGTNNDLEYRSRYKGTAANAITVAYVVAGASTPLTVSVTGNAITVNVATNGSSAATSTAAQVAAAVAASTPANALVTVANATGNDGTGVVTAMTATALTGGSDLTFGRPA